MVVAISAKGARSGPKGSTEQGWALSLDPRCFLLPQAEGKVGRKQPIRFLVMGKMGSSWCEPHPSPLSRPPQPQTQGRKVGQPLPGRDSGWQKPTWREREGLDPGGRAFFLHPQL